MTEIYITSTKDITLEAIYEKLAPFRKEKLDKVKKESEKLLSAAAWLLFEYATAQRGISDTELAYSENGKPFLKNHEGIFFNLSHSEDTALCVLSDTLVGCDVQTKKKIDLRLAKRFFHADELEALNKCDEREELFYRIWTLKESFIKAKGGRLADMKGFCVMEGGNIAKSIKDLDSEYFFKELTYEGAYVAVCAKAQGFSDIKAVELKNP